MRRTLFKFLFISVAAVFACGSAWAQAADNGSIFAKDDKDAPIGFRDMVKKLEIERDKKDFADMQDRGRHALELTNELERSMDHGQPFTNEDRTKVDSLEKLVKKIRRDLGGSDEDEDDPENADAVKKPGSFVEAFRTLQSVTVKLVDELQKTSRFTVSAAAIRSTNAVLRLTRYLKFGK